MRLQEGRACCSTTLCFVVLLPKQCSGTPYQNVVTLTADGAVVHMYANCRVLDGMAYWNIATLTTLISWYVGQGHAKGLPQNNCALVHMYAKLF